MNPTRPAAARIWRAPGILLRAPDRPPACYYPGVERHVARRERRVVLTGEPGRNR
jgi:hypothetical protein